MTLPSHQDLRCERGTALVVALLAMVVMVAIASALMLTAATESRVTRNFKNSVEALYAADAVLERVVDELRGIADWNLVLSGQVRSALVDGEPSGTRVLADGKAIDLNGILNDLNCRNVSGCSGASMDAITAQRPWGINNPRWQPFAWGYLSGLATGVSIDSPFYVVAMVADDPSECDDDPFVDGGAVVSCPADVKANPGAGVLSVRAEAFGPFGAHRVVELTVAHAQNGTEAAEVMPGHGEADNYDNTMGTNIGRPGIRVLSWRDVR